MYCHILCETIDGVWIGEYIYSQLTGRVHITIT
jgi:hypothetical protein